jgi:N-acetylmuramoyl-L-alanine amidase
MNRLSLLLTVLFVCAGITLPASPAYHKVTAKAGDGVISLLRRYKLNDYKANIDQFYKLNSLTTKSHLVKGKNYQIPVLIYKYDGKSIRSTIGQNDWDKAVRIKDYNKYLLQQKLRRSHYMNSKILWVPYHEINGSVAKTNSTVTAKTGTKAEKKVVKKENFFYEPLFGKKNEKVKLFDNQLKGKVFYIVSGHGGPDPGAMCTECPQQLCEDEYAYDVSLRLVRNLMQHGATVHMIIEDKNDGIRSAESLLCDKDERCMGKKIPIRQKSRLKQRAEAVNGLYYKYKKQGIKDQTLICIHVDSRGQNKRQDAFFYYYEPSKSSKKLAHNIQKTFKRKYDKFQKGRGYKGYVSSRSLYMLRTTMPTAVFVELANIRNPSDRTRLIKESNRQALANWLFEGLTGVQ